MPTATFLTLGNTTTQTAWSTMLVGRPLSPPEISRRTVAEFERRSSSFFWANNGDAIAKQSAKTTILLFTDSSFRAKIDSEAKLGIVLAGPALPKPATLYTQSARMARTAYLAAAIKRLCHSDTARAYANQNHWLL